MQEFDSIKVSTYEAEKLAQQLTERSAAGWTVAGIVSAGSDVVAYLSREAGAAAAQPATAASAEPAAATSWSDTSAAAAQPAAAAEPAGWGSAPAESATAEPAQAAADEYAGGWGATSAADTSAGGGEWGTADTSGGYSGGAADTGQGGAPAVPPGWFTDPAGRFDLRYWDGNQWTEHVTRGGQQHTDPPVA